MSSSAAYSGRRFKRAFGNLMLPITTANEKLVSKWREENVWAPFWATVEDHARVDARFQSILQLVFNLGGVETSTEDHRMRLQDFVDHHIPGYQLLFEADILSALNNCLEVEGSIERVLGFRYGKDGRGAMPDRYYQLLLKHKFMVIGNHHDILGHLILFCDPQIRGLTERLANGFSRALEFDHRVKQTCPDPRQFEARTHYLRRGHRLYTLAWNLAQEKLYVQTRDPNGEPILNLIGAFNSVYNTIFSDTLGREQIRNVAGALGFFNHDDNQSLLMSPQALRNLCVRGDEELGGELEDAIAKYAGVWQDLGFDLCQLGQINLAERFEDLVAESLFARNRFVQPSTRARWCHLSRLVLADQDLARIYNKSALIDFSSALINVAEHLFAREQSRIQADQI